jgi:phosphate-selective porin OprO/OprP
VPAGLALAGVLLVLPGPLWAGPKKEPSRAELEERIRRLEEIIREHGLDKPPAARPATRAEHPARQEKLGPSEVEQIVDDKLKKQKVLAGWKDGFFLESPNGDFKLKVRGYLQADARFFPLEQGDTGFDNFFLRRVRPIFEGTVYKHFDYRIMPDFGDGKTVLQDAYLDVKYWPYAQLRGGKFKVPVSLERLQSGSELLFIERSIANNLAPNRDVGFQLWGNVLDGALTYQLGGFNGTIDGGNIDNDTTSDKEVAARVFTEPFKNTGWSPVSGLGFGIGGSYGGQKKGDPLSGLAYKTSGRSTFFKFDQPKGVTLLADGDRYRFDPQAYYFWGPFGVMGEYILSRQGIRSDFVQKKDTIVVRDSIDNTGWFAQASWVLTGENASYRGVVPINPFDLRMGRWGAFELALRGSQVEVDDDAFDLGFAKEPDATREAWAYGAGINWYLNRNFKVQVNYERTDFDTDVKFGKQLRDHEDVLLTRFQISY